MKKMMIAIMALMVISSTAMAGSGNKLADTSEAVAMALVAFESDNTHATVDLFKGVRAAPGTSGVSIKVYLTDGTKQAYACHRHDDSDPFECHQSN
ncbi:MAG: hypothetical protein ACJAS4_003929 [Bacteriovoracaceae bacterium]|jgi:hypothetical protein